MTALFAHDALIALDADGDPRAPGGAVTAELCGHWEHAGLCPTAPHHTAALAEPEGLRLRVLFRVEPVAEATIRAQILRALTAGRITGPDGRETTWTLLAESSSMPQPDEESLLSVA